MSKPESRYIIRYFAAFRSTGPDLPRALAGLYDPEAGTFELWVLVNRGTATDVVRSLIGDVDRWLKDGARGPCSSNFAPDFLGVVGPCHEWIKHAVSFVIEQALKKALMDECVAAEDLGMRSIYGGPLHPAYATATRAAVLGERESPINEDPELAPGPTERRPPPVRKLSPRERFARSNRQFFDSRKKLSEVEQMIPGRLPDPERTLDEEELIAGGRLPEYRHDLLTTKTLVNPNGKRGPKFWQSYVISRGRDRWAVMVCHGSVGSAGKRVEVANEPTKARASSVMRRRAEKKLRGGYTQILTN